MIRSLLIALGLLLAVLGGFIWMAHGVTELSGRGTVRATVTGIGPEAGESLFWGKGRCHTCHSIGARGSAVRGPNLGRADERLPTPIGARAVKRAAERTTATGEAYSAVDYLAEALARPGVHLVNGYKDEMAVAYAPPVSLSLDEIKALVSYMMTQGGDYDPAAITDPSPIAKRLFAIIAVAGAAGGGDPESGAEVFEDNCADCHSLTADDDTLGPSLATIGTKGANALRRAILQPGATVVKGYAVWVAIENSGRRTTGLKTSDTVAEVDLTTSTGEVITLAKADLAGLRTDPGATIMPEDFAEALTVKDLSDLLAFLLVRTGGKP